MHVSYNKLFKLLIDKGLRKGEFANKCDICGSTLAKLSSNKFVSLEVLCRVCVFLDCTLDDIVEIIKDEAEDANGAVEQ